MRKLSTLAQIAVCSVTIAAAGQATSASNIDPAVDGHRYGWSENAGYLNLYGDGASSGVSVSGTSSLSGLSGFAWHENVGWINFGNGAPATPPNYSNANGSDFGVNLDPLTGKLSGLAWGENIGWINFSTFPATGQSVTISKANGQFSGKAWGENVGWISFDVLGANVAATSPQAVPVGLCGFELE